MRDSFISFLQRSAIAQSLVSPTGPTVATLTQTIMSGKSHYCFSFPGQINCSEHCELGRIDWWVQQRPESPESKTRTFEITGPITAYKGIEWWTDTLQLKTTAATSHPHSHGQRRLKRPVKTVGAAWVTFRTFWLLLWYQSTIPMQTCSSDMHSLVLFFASSTLWEPQRKRRVKTHLCIPAERLKPAASTSKVNQSSHALTNIPQMRRVI